MSVPNVTYARACDSWDARCTVRALVEVLPMVPSVPFVTRVYVQRREIAPSPTYPHTPHQPPRA